VEAPVRDPDDLREPAPADPEETREADVHLETIHGPGGERLPVVVTCRHRWDDDPCCGCGHGLWEPRDWEWEHL
jgi:hypothetical protein